MLILLEIWGYCGRIIQDKKKRLIGATTKDNIA